MRYFTVLFIFFMAMPAIHAGKARPLLQRGWEALVKDNDAEALLYFDSAYRLALKEQNTGEQAEALLNMGICTYSVSYTQGLEYCKRAADAYKMLEESEPAQALYGQSRCIQLISTIKGRQGKYRESITLSLEALEGFKHSGIKDSTGSVGLVYNSLGTAYGLTGLTDSSDYYHKLALKEHLANNNLTYLPTAYIKAGDIELRKGNKALSREYYGLAWNIAQRTGNRQAQVSSLLASGKWELSTGRDSAAENRYNEALRISLQLSDKAFYSRVLKNLITLKKQQGNFKQALAYNEELLGLNDSLFNWEKHKIQKSLEVQFDVAEKERRLKLVQNEKDIATLTNYLLWGAICMLLLIAAGIIVFLRRINKRDKLLLQAKEALVVATEEQKRLREQQMQNELEFKESQLSAMTLRMLQNNELLTELKEQLGQDKNIQKDLAVSKIISRGLNQEKEWSDFNSYFESVNKNFYSRLKQAYPDISPNDLKICALIKLNLSIKEMAGILNISPDSVKTARYRLRKKLQLNTEDNLTEFILGL